jgi:hypothetical protein
MQQRTFPAMGTEVVLLLDTEPSAEGDAALAGAEREFELLEALLSRFRPDSGLSALNRLGDLAARGRSCPVGVETGDGQITLALEADVLAKAVFLEAEPEVPAALVTAEDRTVLAGEPA